MPPPQPQTAKLLTLSVAQYREILQNSKNLLTALDTCDYTDLKEQACTLRHLQLTAEKQDKQLLPLLITDISFWKNDDLYRQRLDYINSILQLNKLLIPKIRTIMAATSTELRNVCSGQTALTGYNQQAVKKSSLRGIG